jgi:hypothetical protein
MSSTPLWNILFFFMLVALALLWVSNCWAFAHRSHMVFDCGYVDCTNKIAKINKYIVQIVMWFLHCNCSVPIYYLSRKPNVIRLGYVFVVSLSKCRCVVSVCLIFSILDTLLSESTSWFRQNCDSSDFYLLGTFDPNLSIFCFLSFLSSLLGIDICVFVLPKNLEKLFCIRLMSWVWWG